MELLKQLQRPDIKSANLLLVLGIFLVLVPHFSHQPLWLSLACTLALIWRVCFDLKIYSLPNKKILFILILMLVSGVFFSYHTIVGRNAGSALLIGLLCIKLFETKSYRDISIVVNLAIFSIVINFLFNQSIITATIMVITLVVLFTALIGFQHDYKALNKDAPLPLSRIKSFEKQHFYFATKLLVQAIPFAIVLFFLFPRVHSPLWSLPEDAFSAKTGLSDKMSPGKISRLSDDRSPAFRVEFQSPIPADNKLYWRGPVMWNFDGKTWTAPEHQRIQIKGFEFNATDVKTDYTITLQPHNNYWKFALDIPQTLPPFSLFSVDLQLLSLLPIQKLQRYSVTSYTYYTLPKHPKVSLNRYLQLPDTDYLEKSRELIKELKDENDPLVTVNNVLNYFATQNFYYSRQPPLLHNDPVDEFLFDSRRGYCEHYASSFTVLMRLAGIPARVVTGYQGGELNPINGFMTLRQSDAHAWSEVYIEKEGWKRVDPTAAIPTENIENTNDARRLNSNYKKPAYLFKDSWLSKQFKQAGFVWDAVNNGWNQWVLGYDSKKQKSLFKALGIPEITWQGLTQLLFTFLAVLTAILAFVVFSNSSKNKLKDETQETYLKFLKKLKKKGLIKDEAEGANDFANRAIKELPKYEVKIKIISRLYQKLRYGKATETNLNRLKKHVSLFHVR